MLLGPYEIREELAAGGMGRVLRGYDPATDREVAIKLLLSGRGASPNAKARFLREAKTLAKLRSPNVVQILDAGEEAGSPYLVLAYHPEGSLEDRLARSGPLSVPEALRLGLELTAALQAAHAVGVLHRDLKPDNVLLTGDGRALLTDFGLAKDLTRVGQTAALTVSGTLQGTPGYWAPEQAKGELSSVGPTTDVYGMGAVLYAALSGGPPIAGKGLIPTLEATLNQRPTPLRRFRPEVPPALEALVARCLEKEPEARFQSATELAAALATCQKRPTLPSRRWLTWLLLGALAFGAGVSAILLQGSTSGGSDEALPSAASPALTPQPSARPHSPSERPHSPSEVAYAQGLALLTKRPDEGLELIRRAAEGGLPEAMNSLGTLLHRGLGDPKEARAWVRRAAEAGSPDGMFNYGQLHALGEGGPQDHERAAEWWLRGAEAGSVQAMTAFGLACLEGRGVAEDKARAAEWLTRAAEAENPRGLYLLGLMHAQGEHFPRDLARALALQLRAAELGEADAMAEVGVHFTIGSGTAQDRALGADWYRRAAEAGSLNGMVGYARGLLRGRGVAKDPALAASWLSRAAEQGSAEALTLIGEMHARGLHYPRDPRRAIEYYQRSVELGHPQAMVNLGIALQTGKGTPHDPARAIELLERAADLGSPKAMFNLGALYREVDGRDSARAADWYRRGAEAGYAPAMTILGDCLLRGWGVTKDPALGRKWLSRAAERGDSKGMLSLGYCYLRGIGAPKDPALARKWLEEAAKDPRLQKATRAALQELGD